jgi:hypothetical protein
VFVLLVLALQLSLDVGLQAFLAGGELCRG